MKVSIIVVLGLVMVLSGGTWVEARKGAHQPKINLNPENIQKATAVMQRNREFFSNPENVKRFNRMVENMNKTK